jgi:hypothetical protein
MIMVRWCIPDMSSRLRDQIRREAYITNEIIIQQETMRARGYAFGEEMDSDRIPCAEWRHLSGSDFDLTMLAQHELETCRTVQKRLAGVTHSSDCPVMV